MSIKLFPKNIPQESMLGLNYNSMYDTAIAVVHQQMDSFLKLKR